MSNLSQLLQLEDLQINHKIACYEKGEKEYEYYIGKTYLKPLNLYELGEQMQSGAEFTAPTLCLDCRKLVPFKDMIHTYLPVGMDEDNEDVEPVTICTCSSNNLKIGYKSIYNELIR